MFGGPPPAWGVSGWGGGWKLKEDVGRGHGGLLAVRQGRQWPPLPGAKCPAPSLQVFLAGWGAASAAGLFLPPTRLQFSALSLPEFAGEPGEARRSPLATASLPLKSLSRGLGQRHSFHQGPGSAVPVTAVGHQVLLLFAGMQPLWSQLMARPLSWKVLGVLGS